MDYSRHIAQKGQKAGQWVKCAASGTCPLGGSHITDKAFHAVQIWLKEEKKNNKTLPQITEQDVKDYESQADKTIWDKRYSEEQKAAQKRFRQNDAKRAMETDWDAVMKPLRDSLARDAARAAEPRMKRTWKSLDFNEEDYEDFKRKAVELGATISHDGGSSRRYPDGTKLTTYNNLQVTGPQSATDALQAYVTDSRGRTKRTATYTDVVLTPDMWKSIQSYAAINNVDVGYGDGEYQSIFGFAKRIALSRMSLHGSEKDIKRVQRFMQTLF